MQVKGQAVTILSVLFSQSVYSEIAQASLKLTVLPSEFWDYKQAPHAQHLFLVFINRIK